jgi:hypothetical protein
MCPGGRGAQRRSATNDRFRPSSARPCAGPAMRLDESTRSGQRGLQTAVDPTICGRGTIQPYPAPLRCPPARCTRRPGGPHLFTGAAGRAGRR